MNSLTLNHIREQVERELHAPCEWVQDAISFSIVHRLGDLTFRYRYQVSTQAQLEQVLSEVSKMNRICST